MKVTTSNTKTPLENQKEVDEFLDRQRERQASDGNFATAKRTLAQRKKNKFVICKIDSRLSRKGWVSYNLEIRKGSTRGHTVAWVDQAGEGGAEHVYGHANKEVLTEIENFIWDNCILDYVRYMAENHTGLDINSIDPTDRDLLRYLAPYKRAWLDRDTDKCEIYDGLIGWWATWVAENQYYAKKNRYVKK